MRRSGAGRRRIALDEFPGHPDRATGRHPGPLGPADVCSAAGSGRDRSPGRRLGHADPSGGRCPVGLLEAHRPGRSGRAARRVRQPDPFSTPKPNAGPAPGVPAAQSGSRQRDTIGGVAVQPQFYIGIRWTFSGATFIADVEALTLTYPRLPADGTAEALALWDPVDGWNFAFASVSQFTLPGIRRFVPLRPRLSFVPGTTSWLALFLYPGAVGPPAPPPGGAVAVIPATLSFQGAGSALAQTLAVAQSGSTGPFSVAGCAGIAVVAPGAAGGTFVVTPAAAGTCSLTVSGAGARSAAVNVVVTQTNGSVQ